MNKPISSVTGTFVRDTLRKTPHIQREPDYYKSSHNKFPLR